jgi:hypothetical protein
MGNEAPSTTYIVDGKGFKSEVEFGGQKLFNALQITVPGALTRWLVKAVLKLIPLM